MKNNESDYIFLAESENEENEKDFDEDGYDRKDSDYSEYVDDEIHTLSKHNSLDPSWPQSYRKSMDLYGGVGSPSLSSSFLSLGGSFISSSPKRRHTSKIATTLDNHLLSANQQAQERHSSYHLQIFRYAAV